MAVRVCPRMRAISILEVVLVVVLVVLSKVKATAVDLVSDLKNVAQGHRFGLGFDPVWLVGRYSTPMGIYHHAVAVQL